MDTRNEIAIVAIRPAGDPWKDPSPYSKSMPWRVSVTYTLADGTEQAGNLGPFSRKRDAAESAAARDGITNMTATYRDGAFTGTRTTYRLGA